jgi:TolA-binding protein
MVKRRRLPRAWRRWRRPELWLRGDEHWRRAQATIDYLQGRPADALTLLGPAPDDAAALYLAGLCEAAQGRPLPAAAAFRQVVVRFPHSPLSDAAQFAKANTFLAGGAWRSAAEDFAEVAGRATDSDLVAEATIRRAVALHLDGDSESSITLLRGLTQQRRGTEVAARAQFLLGDVLAATGQHAGAIVALNEVLATYFDRDVAASAQYRIARSYAALGQVDDATAACLAVVTGHPFVAAGAGRRLTWPAAACFRRTGLQRRQRISSSCSIAMRNAATATAPSSLPSLRTENWSTRRCACCRCRGSGRATRAGSAARPTPSCIACRRATRRGGRGRC